MKKTINNNWYVITGAPCSGKTTIIEMFGKKGYTVIYEQARIYIEQELKKDKKLQQIRKNELQFQKKILKLKIALEKLLPKDDIIFFDRGIPDSIAYFKKCGVTDDPVLEKSLRNCFYKKVFFFESLEFQKDHARTENKKEAKLLEKLLEESYKKLGMEIIKVPKLSIEERVQLILDNI